MLRAQKGKVKLQALENRLNNKESNQAKFGRENHSTGNPRKDKENHIKREKKESSII